MRNRAISERSRYSRSAAASSSAKACAVNRMFTCSDFFTFRMFPSKREPHLPRPAVSFLILVIFRLTRKAIFAILSGFFGMHVLFQSGERAMTAEPLAMRPDELSGAITEIISQGARCGTSWIQHPDPLDSRELREITQGILDLLERLGVKLELRVREPPILLERPTPPQRGV